MAGGSRDRCVFRLALRRSAHLAPRRQRTNAETARATPRAPAACFKKPLRFTLNLSFIPSPFAGRSPLSTVSTTSFSSFEGEMLATPHPTVRLPGPRQNTLCTHHIGDPAMDERALRGGMFPLADRRCKQEQEGADVKSLTRGPIMETCLFVVPLREVPCRRSQGQHAPSASNCPWHLTRSNWTNCVAGATS